MNNVQKQKRANKSLPFFFKDEFKVSFIIIFISTILLITTFTFDIVPPILNRGIQPATFPKGLLVLIIVLTLIIYYLSIKKPWKVEKKITKSFFFNIREFFNFCNSFKNFRFLFSDIVIICLCFILLGGKKNFFFSTSKCSFSDYSIYFFWDNFRFKISSWHNHKYLLPILKWKIYF